MIFIDSNIPMYLIGKPHPHKVDAQRLLETAVANDERLVTDAEVFQEILHRYAVIDRKDAIQPAFDVLQGVLDEVFPVLFEDTVRAEGIVLNESNPASVRDALHLAVMERMKIDRIMTFDTDFDHFEHIQRIA